MEIKKGYKQTEIGIIPSDWEVKRLGDALSIKYGKSQAEISDVNGNFPILGTGGIVGFTNQFLYDKSSIIIGRKGSIDKPQYIDNPFWTIDTAFYTVVKNGYDVKFLYYKFCCVDWYSYNEASGVPSLNAPTIEKIPFAIPLTLAEQTAIATALSDMDKYISSLERLIAKKKAIKQGTMQNLLTGKIRLKGFEGEWVEKKLGKEQITMGQSPSSDGYNNERQGMPLIQGNADIENRKTIIRFYTKQITKQANQGDIILTVRAPVGNVAKAKFNCCLGRGVCAIKGNDFLFHLLISIEPNWSNLSTGSTFDSINNTELSNLKLFLPTDLAEQTAIATILSDMDTEIEALQTKLQKAKLVKQGAMQELLTGKIRLVENKSEAKAIAQKPKKTGHNDQINEAVVISFLVYKFGTVQYPLARFRYTKFAYLLHRRAEHEAKGFQKHAAGPYKPENRYKGGEGISLRNNYIVKVKNPLSGADAFISSENINEALNYFTEWYGTDIQKWIERFRRYTNDYLEVLTTVDESICDLQGQNKTITVGSIKEYIGSISQWKGKLSKPCFNDINIQKAINESYNLFRE
ncbi:MAG: restriction endonuclease subunit S [Lentimicrobiaceae bacterium]|nr:restriction endonuclease subunit S [Lentimicrobiaceae bacterium]